MKPIRSEFRFRDLSLVFPAGSLLHAHIARMCVLYEDLRVEMNGISEGSLAGLDQLSPDYRRNLFLRRSVLTIREFAESFRLLNQLDDFQWIKRGFDDHALRYWERAVQFFSKHENLLTDVRNDLGGHFGLRAARYAVDNLLTPNIGKIETNVYGKGGGVKLHFASEIAATAFLKHLKGSSSKHKFTRLLRILNVGYRYAIWANNLIVQFYLRGRFGR